jgi:hypothetical protein
MTYQNGPSFSSSDVLEDEFEFIQHANRSHHGQIRELWIQCDYCRLLMPDSEVS